MELLHVQPSVNWLSVRITEVRNEAIDVISLVLRSATATPLPYFEPGAHVDLRVDATSSRAYTISNQDATDGTYRLTIQLSHTGRRISLPHSGGVAFHFTIGHLELGNFPEIKAWKDGVFGRPCWYGCLYLSIPTKEGRVLVSQVGLKGRGSQGVVG